MHRRCLGMRQTRRDGVSRRCTSLTRPFQAGHGGLLTEDPADSAKAAQHDSARDGLGRRQRGRPPAVGPANPQWMPGVRLSTRWRGNEQAARPTSRDGAFFQRCSTRRRRASRVRIAPGAPKSAHEWHRRASGRHAYRFHAWSGRSAPIRACFTLLKGTYIDHLLRSIRTMSEFSRKRSNTICLPSGVTSKVRIASVPLRRVSCRDSFVATSNRKKFCAGE